MLRNRFRPYGHTDLLNSAKYQSYSVDALQKIENVRKWMKKLVCNIE